MIVGVMGSGRVTNQGSAGQGSVQCPGRYILTRVFLLEKFVVEYGYLDVSMDKSYDRESPYLYLPHPFPSL
jgi:hypothetical protein